MPLVLTNTAPFAQGGNRLCFVHPNNPNRVIKVRRPDLPLEQKRARKGFPKRYLPLSNFDDNAEENRVMQTLDRLFGPKLYALVSKSFGFIETDMGAGLMSELIRDDSSKISHTLKQYIWENGVDRQCQAALNQFANSWLKLAVPSRDLLLHNIVVQKNADAQIERLVVIDGIGSPNIIPSHWLPYSMRKKKAQKKLDNLAERIQVLLNQRGEDKFPGYHGLLIHEGEAIDSLKSSPNGTQQ
ncbi:MAG: PhoP regulatory network YrbL family protein [Pseudomonadales bacterium]|nr:PhoP regulatory network YrbL family protein [Pseudomonadales bacterium]